LRRTANEYVVDLNTHYDPSRVWARSQACVLCGAGEQSVDEGAARHVLPMCGPQDVLAAQYIPVVLQKVSQKVRGPLYVPSGETT